MKKMFIGLLIIIILASCAPSSETIEQAIAQTQTAIAIPTQIAETVNAQVSEIVMTQVAATVQAMIPVITQVEPVIATKTAEPIVLIEQPTAIIVSDTTQIASKYLGDYSQDFGYAVAALEVIDPATPSRYEKITAGYKLVAVDISIMNISGQPNQVWTSSITLIDNEGFAYEGVDKLRYNFESVVLNQGEQARGFVGFEVPGNVTTYPAIKFNLNHNGGTIQTSLVTPPTGYKPEAIQLNTNPPLSKLGEVVEKSGYSLSAITVENPTTRNDPNFDTRYGNKIVCIDVVFGNISGDDSYSLFLGEFQLVDENGFVYMETNDFDRGVDFILADISVGEKKKGWVSFEVPENANPMYLKYQFAWEEDEIIIGLGN